MSITLITGASSGIGRSLALSFAARGETIVALARRRTLLDTLVGEIGSAGGRGLAVECDVTDRDQVRRAFDIAERQIGPIDRLIANAGGGERMKVDDFSAVEIERMLLLNVVGAANCIEGVLPSMLKRQEGHIVVTSSLAGFRGLPAGAAGYSAAKAALTALMEGLRIDLAPRGIAVTILLPGRIRTKDRKRKLLEMELDAATRSMVTAILARKPVHAFPFIPALLARVFRLLPAAIADPLLARLIRGKE